MVQIVVPNNSTCLLIVSKLISRFSLLKFTGLKALNKCVFKFVNVSISELTCYTLNHAGALHKRLRAALMPHQTFIITFSTINYNSMEKIPHVHIFFWFSSMLQEGFGLLSSPELLGRRAGRDVILPVV